MRFICLGYYNEAEWQSKSPAQIEDFMERCFAYDDELRRKGHFAGGFALKSMHEAVTVRPAGGKVEITDGPYAETKEQIGGILILEARDLNQAIALMSAHPGSLHGPFEIRPEDEQLTALMEERARTVGERQ